MSTTTTDNRVTGIIGGSGLYRLDSIRDRDIIEVNTPFGKPSGGIVTGELNGHRVAFISRHGAGHFLNPSEVNYRANLFALKLLGADSIISLTATGSLKEKIKPTHLVIPDQYIDGTYKREKTFFENGIVAHVSMAAPVCPYYSRKAYDVAKSIGINVHQGGTYYNMEGPQFSSKAESHFYIREDCSVIGMTQAVEAKLAKELEICFIPLAFVTDYDCWHPETAHVTVEMVVENLTRNVANSLNLIEKLISMVHSSTPDCTCSKSLEGAIMTDFSRLDQETLTRVKPIVSKYIPMEN